VTFAVSLCLALCSLAAARAWAAEGPEAAAQAAAESWLTLVDAGQYAESWDHAATLFRGAVTRNQWEQAVEGVRGPLGKVVSRKIKARQYTEHLPGAPDGEYVVLQYDTVFANKASAVETVTPMLDKDGTWRVSGYLIK
jgi:Protein of unknown function (DUF4019)